MNRTYLLFFIALLVTLIIACSSGGNSTANTNENTDNTENTESTTTAYQWNLPEGFPIPNVPENNPMTQEKVTLGRYLFYDTKLSGNYTTSCASCHLQEKSFTDGLDLAIGSTGEIHPRSSQNLVNVAYNATFAWANPALVTIEQHMRVPMFGEFPVELGITGVEQEVLGRFQADAFYQDLFQQAYPDQEDPINFDNIIKAIASFIRTIISGNSAYDLYFQGGDSALSESAQRGMDLFFSERFECHHCHAGFNFTGSTTHENLQIVEKSFHNTGLYNIDGQGGYPEPNRGIYEFTFTDIDMGRFRAPTLRNIELTAPYMHDGSIATLEEVIDFYAAGGRIIETGEYAGDGRVNPYKSGFVGGFIITEEEKQDLINFLKSLTDESVLTNPELSDPF